VVRELCVANSTYPGSTVPTQECYKRSSSWDVIPFQSVSLDTSALEMCLGSNNSNAPSTATK
jgi:hypothetical protein